MQKRKNRARRTAILITAGVAVLLVAAGVAVALRESSSRAPALLDPPAAAPLSEDALSRAADLVGFKSTMGPDVGIVENLPADTPLLPGSATLLPAGKMAPDFALRTPTGEQVRLSDLRGKTVLLEFFATWCPHCQAEASHLLALSESLPRSAYVFLSVNADGEDAASIFAFDRWFKIPWPTLVDPGSPPGSFRTSGGAGAVTRAFGISLYPTFYVIDPKGRIAWRTDREQPDALLLKKLHDAAGR